MRKLAVFNSISLDGNFTTASGDMSWAHQQDPEWQAFTTENAQGGETAFLFGRTTYEQMASFWPTPAAAAAMPAVAAAMNARTKYVASRTLTSLAWEGAQLLRGDLVDAVRALKAETGPDLLILGSGSIVAQLAAAALVDHYTLVLSPTALGSGRSLFEGLPRPLRLVRESARTFQNGNVVLTYAPS